MPLSGVIAVAGAAGRSIHTRRAIAAAGACARALRRRLRAAGAEMVVGICLSWKLQRCVGGLESAHFGHPVGLGPVRTTALFAQAKHAGTRW